MPRAFASAQISFGLVSIPVRLFTAITQDDDWSAYRALRDLSVDVEVCRRMAESLARDEAQGSLPE